MLIPIEAGTPDQIKVWNGVTNSTPVTCCQCNCALVLSCYCQCVSHITSISISILLSKTAIAKRQNIQHNNIA